MLRGGSTERTRDRDKDRFPNVCHANERLGAFDVNQYRILVRSIVRECGLDELRRQRRNPGWSPLFPKRSSTVSYEPNRTSIWVRHGFTTSASLLSEQAGKTRAARATTIGRT